MEIPYYILLIVYLLGIGVFLLWTFFNVWHLMKFGFFDFTGKLNATIFILYSVAVVVLTFLLLSEVQWLDSFNLFSVPSNVVPGGSAIDISI